MPYIGSELCLVEDCYKADVDLELAEIKLPGSSLLKACLLEANDRDEVDEEHKSSALFLL